MPLNHIINNFEVALDGNMERCAEEHVKASLTASKSLIYVISDLLDITKSEEPDSRMHEEPFSLQGLMLQVLGVFAMEAERKGLKLSFSSDTAHLPGMIIGDPQRLQQAISNILNNSVEHSNYWNIDIKVQSLKATNNILSGFSIDITIRDEGKGCPKSISICYFINLKISWTKMMSRVPKTTTLPPVATKLGWG
jgi:signal transduction histidine kinase